uniref:Mannosyl-glycoprotein endo-beta-N-acetylglucosaminidase n=1 Tax=Macrostomum lignano TaxID=282301 RepID=A0A1I8JQ02_9PLAT
MEVIDLIISDCRPPRPLAQQEQALVCLVLRVLASLAASNDRDNLTPDEEAHYLRLVSLVHDLLLMPPSLDRRPLLESCLEVLLTVPLIAFEELTTPLEGTVDVACRFEDKNLSAVNSLVEFLRHCLREPPAPAASAPASPVLTEASISQRSVRCFLRSLILPKHPHLPAASSSSTTSAAAAAGGGDIDTEDESVTETEANSLLSDPVSPDQRRRTRRRRSASASGSCGSSSSVWLDRLDSFCLCCAKRMPPRWCGTQPEAGLTQFPALVHSLQIPCHPTSPTATASGGSLDAYSSDSSEEEILDPEVSVAACCSQSRAATPSALAPREDLPTSSPRVLVCHDMQGGYLDDAYLYGNANASAFRLFHWHLIDSGLEAMRQLLSNEKDAIGWADRLIDLADAGGFDGWLINVEVALPAELVPALQAFVRRLKS